jgi:hypothetical protein
MSNFPVYSYNLAYNTGTSTQYTILTQIYTVILNAVHLTSAPVTSHSIDLLYHDMLA